MWQGCCHLAVRPDSWILGALAGFSLGIRVDSGLINLETEDGRLQEDSTESPALDMTSQNM